MNDHPIGAWVRQQVELYPLVEALLGRRSRRFGPGMTIPAGPFQYQSKQMRRPLTEPEEAALVFSAAGFSGPVLADLSYGRAQGGSMLAGLAGRVIASPDAINTSGLFVINDEATYFIKRPQNFPPAEQDEMLKLAEAREWVTLYRRLRVRIADSRTNIPVEPGINFNINKWSLYAPGSTYFLPVNDLTALTINALLEAFDPEMGLFIVDERNLFLPAGISRFGRNRGGHLWNKPADGRVATIQGLEMSLAEAAAVEMGGMLHSLGLMGQTLGLGGFCNYARNEYHWLAALGFDTQKFPSTRYVGMNPVLGRLASLLGQSFDIPLATGLNKDGLPLWNAYCRPNYPDMESAVLAFVEHKFGEQGVWRQQTAGGSWQTPEKNLKQIQPPGEAAIAATIAYCQYIDRRYGRFPAYSAPFRTVIGYQASHVDIEFYDRFYKPGALTETQRRRAEIEKAP